MSTKISGYWSGRVRAGLGYIRAKCGTECEDLSVPILKVCKSCRTNIHIEIIIAAMLKLGMAALMF